MPMCATLMPSFPHSPHSGAPPEEHATVAVGCADCRVLLYDCDPIDRTGEYYIDRIGSWKLDSQPTAIASWSGSLGRKLLATADRAGVVSGVKRVVSYVRISPERTRPSSNTANNGELAGGPATN